MAIVVDPSLVFLAKHKNNNKNKQKWKRLTEIKIIIKHEETEPPTLRWWMIHAFEWFDFRGSFFFISLTPCPLSFLLITIHLNETLSLVWNAYQNVKLSQKCERLYGLVVNLLAHERSNTHTHNRHVSVSQLVCLHTYFSYRCIWLSCTQLDFNFSSKIKIKSYKN